MFFIKRSKFNVALYSPRIAMDTDFGRGMHFLIVSVKVR